MRLVLPLALGAVARLALDHAADMELDARLDLLAERAEERKLVRTSKAKVMAEVGQRVGEYRLDEHVKVVPHPETVKHGTVTLRGGQNEQLLLRETHYAEVWLATHTPTDGSPSQGQFAVKLLRPLDSSCLQSVELGEPQPKCEFSPEDLRTESQGCAISQMLHRKARETAKDGVTKVNPDLFNLCYFDGTQEEWPYLLLKLVGDTDPESSNHYSKWETLGDATKRLNADPTSVRHLRHVRLDEYGNLCRSRPEHTGDCDHQQIRFMGAKVRLKILERILEAIYVMSEYKGLEDPRFGAYVYRGLDPQTVLVNVQDPDHVGVVMIDFALAFRMLPRFGQREPGAQVDGRSWKEVVQGSNDVLRCDPTVGFLWGPVSSLPVFNSVSREPLSYWNPVMVELPGEDPNAPPRRGYPRDARPDAYVPCPFNEVKKQGTSSYAPPEVWTTLGDTQPVEAQICDDTVFRRGGGTYGHGSSFDIWALGVLDFQLQGGTDRMLQHLLVNAYPPRPENNGTAENAATRQRNSQVAKHAFSKFYDSACAGDPSGAHAGCPYLMNINVNDWPIVNHQRTLAYSETHNVYRYLLARLACDRPRASTVMVMVQCVLNLDCPYRDLF